MSSTPVMCGHATGDHEAGSTSLGFTTTAEIPDNALIVVAAHYYQTGSPTASVGGRACTLGPVHTDDFDTSQRLALLHHFLTDGPIAAGAAVAVGWASGAFNRWAGCCYITGIDPDPFVSGNASGNGGTSEAWATALEGSGINSGMAVALAVAPNRQIASLPRGGETELLEYLEAVGNHSYVLQSRAVAADAPINVGGTWPPTVGGWNAVHAVYADAPDPPVNTVAPFITGVSDTGRTVTCQPGTWDAVPAPSFTYQWKRNGANIGGATSAAYTLQVADEDQDVSCTVTATNASGTDTADSNTIVPGPPGAIAWFRHQGDWVQISQEVRVEGEWTDPHFNV